MWLATRRVPCSCRRSSATAKGCLAALTLGTASGGTNWPGAAYDPETHTVYAQANQSALFPISMRTPPAGFSDLSYVMGRNDTEFRVSEGPGFGSAADAPQPSAQARGASTRRARGSRRRRRARSRCKACRSSSRLTR